MTNSSLRFADDYAQFRSDLEGANGSIEYLSQRGLISALLTVFRELRDDADPAAAIAGAIRAYRQCERQEAEQLQARQVREQARRAADAAREAAARAAGCPHCRAAPQMPCQTAAGKMAPRSHQARHLASLPDQVNDDQVNLARYPAGQEGNADDR
jgi:hypothetical protein